MPWGDVQVYTGVCSIESTIARCSRTCVLCRNLLFLFFFRRKQVAFQPEFLRAVSCEEDARAPWQIVFGCGDAADDTRARMSNCFLDL